MKTSLALSATFLSSFASAAIIPSTSTDGSSARDITTVAGTTDPDHLLIHFKVPAADDNLAITLDVDSADEECTTTPRVNGLHLLQSTTGDFVATNGRITFKSEPGNGLGQKEIHASWETLCLKGNASFLSVLFDEIAGEDSTQGRSGFSASYKQVGQPTILRLQDKPLKESNPDKICNLWLQPDDSHKVSIAPHTADDLLGLGYEKLDSLLSQLSDTHSEAFAIEKAIFTLVKEEFKACSSLKCFWNTAKSKAPVICKLISAHWKHKISRFSGCTKSESQSACQAQEQLISTTESAKPEKSPITQELESMHTKTSSLSRSLLPAPTAISEDMIPTSIAEDATWQAPPTALPEVPGQEAESVPPPHVEEIPHGPPFDHHGPPPWVRPHGGEGPPFGGHGPPWFRPHDGGGPPPWFRPHGGEGSPPGHHGPPPWFRPHDGNGPPPGHHGPPPWFRPGHGPPPWFKPGQDSPAGHHGPHHGPHHGRPGFSSLSLDSFSAGYHYRVALAVVSLVFLVITAAVLFKLVRLCQDPRRRAERAAWKEERRTKRLYRKAACEHRWKTFWSRARRSRRGDYEEKRSSILREDGRTDNILYRQLRTWRDATDLVRKLVAAEEGRYASSPDVQQHASRSRPDYSVGEAGSSSRPQPDILPLYVAPPPRYEEEIEGEITVVDGFNYTPSHSGYTPSTTDDTAESSVVDCSPRLSFETGRSTIFTKDEKD